MGPKARIAGMAQPFFKRVLDRTKTGGWSLDFSRLQIDFSLFLGRIKSGGLCLCLWNVCMRMQIGVKVSILSEMVR